MKAFRAAFSGRGIVAAVLALILLTQVQATMACALADSTGPADCPCPASTPASTEGCVDMAAPSEAVGCCAFDLKVSPKVANAGDPAASGPLLSIDFPKAPPPSSSAVRIADPPPVSARSSAPFVAPDGTGIYLRTARLRL